MKRLRCKDASVWPPTKNADDDGCESSVYTCGSRVELRRPGGQGSADLGDMEGWEGVRSMEVCGGVKVGWGSVSAEIHRESMGRGSRPST